MIHSAKLAGEENLNKPNLENPLESFASFCHMSHYKLWSLTVSKSMKPCHIRMSVCIANELSGNMTMQDLLNRSVVPGYFHMG